MSLKAMRWAWEMQQVTRTQKIILLSMADRANDETGECWPSIRRLCLDTNCSERTVQRSIKIMEKIGIIRCDRVSGRVTRYTLVKAPPPQCHPRQCDAPQTDATPVMVTPTPVTVTPDPRHGDTQNLKENQKRNEERAPARDTHPHAESLKPYGKVFLTDRELVNLQSYYGMERAVEAVKTLDQQLNNSPGVPDSPSSHYLTLRRRLDCKKTPIEWPVAQEKIDEDWAAAEAEIAARNALLNATSENRVAP